MLSVGHVAVAASRLSRVAASSPLNPKNAVKIKR